MLLYLIKTTNNISLKSTFLTGILHDSNLETLKILHEQKLLHNQQQLFNYSCKHGHL